MLNLPIVWKLIGQNIVHSVPNQKFNYLGQPFLKSIANTESPSSPLLRPIPISVIGQNANATSNSKEQHIKPTSKIKN